MKCLKSKLKMCHARKRVVVSIKLSFLVYNKSFKNAIVVFVIVDGH